MKCGYRRRDVAFGFVTALLLYTLLHLLTLHSLLFAQEQMRQASVVDRNSFSEDLPADNTSIPDFRKWTNKVAKIARSIYFAKKHVRGSKTSDFLQTALAEMDSLLTDLQLDKNIIYRRETTSSKSVCPEEYKGSTYGYPFFYNGFEFANCTYGKPLSKLVTVVKIFPEEVNEVLVQRFVQSVTNAYNNSEIVIGIKNKELPSFAQKYISSKLTIRNFNRIRDGTIINNLLDAVHTPYILIARHAEILTPDSRLGRLIRELESMKLAATAGAFRTADGHWSKGCFQTMYRNFTLKYIEGYDESLHECLFCDYVSGPFLTAKETLQKDALADLDDTAGVFEEWFLRLTTRGHEIVVCPDSMFHVSSQDKHRDDYQKLMSIMQLNKLKTPDGRVLTENCEFSHNSFSSSRALSPCLLKANADMVNDIMNACESERILCELQEGTALGAVKLGGVLPWERDGDLTFLSSNYTAFRNLKDFFTKRGYIFSDLGAQWCCADNRTAGGKYNIRKGNWHIEMYGQHMMDSEILLEHGKQPTKVLLDGNWVNVPRNPGLFVRNRYGHEIYQHALHWLTTGAETGWQPYKTNTYMTCDTPGRHDCLDRFNADGDLPFKEFMP